MTAAMVTFLSWQKWLGMGHTFPLQSATERSWNKNMVSLVSSVTELMHLPVINLLLSNRTNCYSDDDA